MIKKTVINELLKLHNYNILPKNQKYIPISIPFKAKKNMSDKK